MARDRGVTAPHELGKEPLRKRTAPTYRSTWGGEHATSPTTSGTATTELPWEGPDATSHPTETQIPPLKSL